MKLPTAILLCATITIMMTSCYTTSQKLTDTPTEEPVFRELIDLISKEPGVQVKKMGSNYDITIRSQGTFITSHQPLFVVDGIATGTSYADVAQLVPVTEVQSIRVIKGADATSYGSRGANGVIEIRLRKGR